MTVPYTGVSNLEVMESAVRYNRHLSGILAGASPASGGVTVDFGAGTGNHAVAARGLGHDVVCVEADDGLRARLDSLGFLAVADLDQLEPGSVRFVYSFNVLEHIDDDEAVLRQMARVLAPGGVLLLYVPAFDALFGAMDRRVGHLRRYTRGVLCDRVRRSGFAVEAARYVDSLGFFAALAYRLLPAADGQLDARSVRLYDRAVFPLSLRLDRAVGRWFGKNLTVVAHRTP